MAEIKNLHLIKTLPEEELTKLEYCGLQHRRHMNIKIKILSISDRDITVQLVQEKNPSGRYHTQKRLIELGHEIFEPFLPGLKVYVRATAYTESAVDKVDFKWVQTKMMEGKIKLKDIENETGLNKTQLSAVISGAKPFSQVTKALMYYYFMAKGCIK